MFQSTQFIIVIQDIYLDHLNELHHGPTIFPPAYYTAISSLQHRCLALGRCPRYNYTQLGLKHAPLFICEVQVLGYRAKGRGTRKKLAKHAAANRMMDLLHKKIFGPAALNGIHNINANLLTLTIPSPPSYPPCHQDTSPGYSPGYSPPTLSEPKYSPPSSYDDNDMLILPTS